MTVQTARAMRSALSKLCTRPGHAASTAQGSIRAHSCWSWSGKQPQLQLDFLAPSWLPKKSLRTARCHEAPYPPSTRQARLFGASSRQSAKAIQNPRLDEDGQEMTVNITPRAAHRLRAIAEADQNPDLALRVSVESGGCHGFQYLMSLTSIKELDDSVDTLFEDDVAAKSTETYRPKVVMDESSLELLKGSNIDYTMELIGSQFKVTGIPGATSSCGCGTSFDIGS